MQAKRQVEGGNISEVDTIEVRVRGSKGDQGWKEAVLVRIKGDTDNRGEAVELLQELYEIQRRNVEPIADGLQELRGLAGMDKSPLVI